MVRKQLRVFVVLVLVASALAFGQASESLIAQSSITLSVDGRGASGTETFQVKVNGSNQSTISFGSTTGTYSTQVPGGTDWEDIQLVFTDGSNKDLFLTRFTLDGDIRTMTAGDVLVSGQWTGSACSSLGPPIDDAIRCNGTVEFPANGGGGGGGSDSDLDPSFWGDAQTIVPVYDTVWDLGVSARTEQVEEYAEFLSNEGFSGFATTYLGSIHRPARRDDQPNFFVRPDPYGNAIATWDAATGNLIMGSAHADRFEDFLDAAHAEGQRVLLYVIWERKAVDEYELINEGNAYNWAFQVGSRFKDHPAIQSWVLGGDAAYDDPRSQLWSNAASGLRAAGVTGDISYGTGSSPQRRLNNLDASWNMGQHVQTSHCGTPSLIDQRISGVVAQADIPVWAGEMRYEAINATWCNPPVPIPGAVEVRADALAAVAAGADGIIYGHNDRWQWGHGSLGGNSGGWNAVKASFNAPGHTAVLNALAGTPPQPDDMTPPVVAVTAPTSGSTVASATVQVTGSATDDDSAIATLEVMLSRVTGGSAEHWTGSTWVSAGPVVLNPNLSGSSWTLANVDTDQDGLYTVTAAATDAAGNDSSTATSTFTAVGNDTVDPVVLVTDPSSGEQLLPSNSATITGTASDDASGLDLVRVRIRRSTATGNQYWNGSSWQSGVFWRTVSPNASGQWSLTGVDLSSETSYVVQVLGRDNSGNVSTASENPSVSFNVSTTDVTGPIVRTTLPTDASTVPATSSFDITGTATDPSGVDFVRLRLRRLSPNGLEYWSGSSWGPSAIAPFATLANDGTWTLPDVDLSQEGAYRIQLIGRDELSNMSFAGSNGVVWFDVAGADSTGPVVAVSTPTEGQIVDVDGPLLTIAGTATDVSGVDFVRVRIRRSVAGALSYWNGSSWVGSSVWLNTTPNSGGAWSISGLDPDEVGSYRINLIGFDNAGNISTAAQNQARVFLVR